MENASEYEAPRMSIQTKDLIRYNNHITYYKKNHSDFIQKSHYNSTNRQQTPSIYFVRQPEIFSLFKEMRGGEAFIVAKAMLPSSRSTPPGHAAVLRCGMCCFAGEVMYSTVLVVVGCADMSGCSTVISLLTNTNTISHNLSIHITSYPPL